jgi:hypothetical protein
MTTTTPTTPTLVEAARETLRQRWKTELREAKTKLAADAEAAWVQAEQRRHADFVQEYQRKNTVNDNPPTNPYLGLSDASAVRIAMPAEDRYTVLGQQGYYDELLYCYLVRNNCCATIDEAKIFFAPHLRVDGDVRITETLSGHREVVHAVGLSRRFAELLTSTWAVGVEFSKIVWTANDIDPDEY